MRQEFYLLLNIVLLLAFLLQGCGGGSDGGGGTMSGSSGVGSTASVVAPAGAIVQGIITDKNSYTPLSGVTVTVAQVNATSDTQGNYCLKGVPAGKQKITTLLNDYYEFNDNVIVSDGQTVTKNIMIDEIPHIQLGAATSYKWQVEAVDTDGVSTMGPEWTFTTGSGTAAPLANMKTFIDTDTARKIAETHLKRTDRKELEIDTLRVLDDVEGGCHLAFVFSLKPAGYIVVPCRAIDLVPPVIACSFTSSFSWDDSQYNILLPMLRKDIQLREEAFSKGAGINLKSSTRNARLWREYISGETGLRVSARAHTDPLIGFHTWSQGWPFNTKCPIDITTGKSCEVGCVATAMAQIFNYWQSPTALTFTTTDSYTTETGHLNIDATTASFSALNYNSGSPDNNTKATLSFACGVLVKMDYTSSGSIAYPNNVQRILAERCGYKDTKIKTYNGADVFKSADIISSLKKSAPCMLAVSGSSLGHEVVCDGYDAEGPSFHLNFGWNGVSDGWYDLPNGMPDGYSVVKAVIYDIYIKDSIPAMSKVPQNPHPSDISANVPLDAELTWDECASNSYYNLYIWPVSDPKPAEPQVPKLTAPVY